MKDWAKWLIPFLAAAAICLVVFTRRGESFGPYTRNYAEGRELELQGHWREAAVQYEKDLVLNPGSPEAHLNLAILYDDYLERKSDAVRHYELYLQAQPQGERSRMVRRWLGRSERVARLEGAKKASRRERTQELREARLKIQALEQEKSRATGESDRLAQEIKSLKQTAAARDLEIAKLKQQPVVPQAPQPASVALKQDLDEANAEIAKLKSLLKETQKDFDEAQSLLKSLSDEIDFYKKEKESASARIAELDRAKTALEGAVEQLRNALEMKSHRDSAQRTAYRLAADNSRLKSDLNQSQAAVIRLNGVIESLKGANASLKNQIEELKKTLSSRKIQVASRPARIIARRYQVKKGESLRTIAIQFYGDKYQWRRIYEANRGRITDPNLLTPGQIIEIPE